MSLKKYLKIPVIIFHLGLKANELAFYCHVYELCEAQGSCSPTNSVLGRSLGLHRDTISLIKKSLSQPRDCLGGLPLIIVEKRKMPGCKDQNELLTIVRQEEFLEPKKA